MNWGGGNDAGKAEAIRRIKKTARALLDPQDGDVVLVTELRCTEPGCPPTETVVALLRDGSAPRQVKVHKAAVDVTTDDLRAALAAPGNDECSTEHDGS